MGVDTLASFCGVSLPNGLVEYEDDFALTRESTLPVVWKDGYIDNFLAATAPRSGGIIRALMRVQGTSEANLRANLDTLRGLSGRYGALYLTRANWPTVYCNCRLMDVAEKQTVRDSRFTRMVNLRFMAPYPAWQSSSTSNHTFTANGTSTDSTLTHTGNGIAIPESITIQATSGKTIENPKISIVSGGVEIDFSQYLETLTSLQILTLTPSLASAVVGSTDVWDLMSVMDLRFLRLRSGNNTVRVTALNAGAQASIGIVYRSTWF